MNKPSTPTTVDPSSFRISIPRGHPRVVDCPVEGCPFKVKVDSSSKRGQMCIHFRSCHVRDSICIKEEEGQLPRCTRCGIFMKDTNSARHHGSVECRKFSTIVRKKEVRAEHQVEALEVSFTSIGGVEIEHVKQFQYLGRVLDHENDNDSHAAG